MEQTTNKLEGVQHGETKKKRANQPLAWLPYHVLDSMSTQFVLCLASDRMYFSMGELNWNSEAGIALKHCVCLYVHIN